MKALLLSAYNQLDYVDVPDPEFMPNEVLIRVKACAICGSDVHGYDGSSGRRIAPVIMGHEAAGVIEMAGKNVECFKTGDRVTFDSTIYCRICAPCISGRVNLCDNKRILGVSCDDYRRDGAMADYIAVPEHILYRLPDKITFEEAALIEPLSVALHAINRTGLRIGDDVLVVGCGTIGQMIIRLLSITGCGSVTAIDIDTKKLDMARNSGADYIFNPGAEDAVDHIKALTDGKKADAAFEAVGVSDTIALAAQSIKKGGKLTLIGNIQKNISFPLQSVVTNEIDIVTSCAINGEYDTCLKLMAAGKIRVKDIISKTAPLSEGAQWFSKLHEGLPGVIKVVLNP